MPHKAAIERRLQKGKPTYQSGKKQGKLSPNNRRGAGSMVKRAKHPWPGLTKGR